MKITLRDVGVSGAIHATPDQLAHIRIGITEADLTGLQEWANLTIEFADRATLETVLENVLYAAGLPAFTRGEWRDLANFVEAGSLDMADSARERARHYAKQIRDAYGVGG